MEICANNRAAPMFLLSLTPKRDALELGVRRKVRAVLFIARRSAPKVKVRAEEQTRGAGAGSLQIFSWGSGPIAIHLAGRLGSSCSSPRLLGAVGW